MVTMSAPERPQREGGESLPGHDAGRPELNLSDKTPPPPAGPGVAGRRHQTWASRVDSGQRANTGQQQPAMGRGTGWEVVSYLLAGMTVYGGIGWVIGHYTHIELLFPVGMVIGLAISLGWVVYRFGRK
jgi:ATP synthase protein I